MRTTRRLTRWTRAAVCAAALAVVLPLAACSGGSDGGSGEAPVLTTVEETSTAAQAEESDAGRQARPTTGAGRAGASRGSGRETPDDGGGCGTMSAEEAMYTGVSQVDPPPYEGVGWDTDYGDPAETYDPCADLSWIMLLIEGPTASSPKLIMLYHRGEFLGTTTSDPYWVGDVRRDSDSRITVTYKYSKPGEGVADATGRTYASYTWNGEKVVMTGEVPEY